MRTTVPMVTLTLFLAACSSGGDATDGGVDGFDAADSHDGGQDAGDPTDAGPDGSDSGPRPDHDPESSILIEVPPGASLCSRFSIARTWQQELAMIGRVDLKPGFYILPREQGTSEVEFIQAVVFGPEGQDLPVAAAAGELRAVYQEIEEPEWVYTFSKEFDLEGQPYRLEVALSVTGGPDWPSGLTLDADTMFDRVEGQARIGPGVDPIDEMQTFDPCELPERGWQYMLTGEDGSVVHLEERFCTEPPEFCAGCTICHVLYAAYVKFDGVERTLTDRLDTVYSASHHNINPFYLIRLDPPIGQAAFVLVDGLPCYGQDIVSFDADRVEIGRTVTADCQQNYRQ